MAKYDDLLSGDVFHSRSQDLIGDTIAFWTTWGKPNKDTPNHSGFIYKIGAQVMVAEVDGKGFKLNSIEKYVKSDKNRIVLAYRPQANVTGLVREIEYKLRKDADKPYDLIGAVSSAPFIKRWFSWLFKPSSKKEFCSEVVAQVMKISGLSVPPSWDNEPPNPLELSQWQAVHKDQWTLQEVTIV